MGFGVISLFKKGKNDNISHYNIYNAASPQRMGKDANIVFDRSRIMMSLMMMNQHSQVRFFIGKYSKIFNIRLNDSIKKSDNLFKNGKYIYIYIYLVCQKTQKLPKKN